METGNIKDSCAIQKHIINKQNQQKSTNQTNQWKTKPNQNNPQYKTIDEICIFAHKQHMSSKSFLEECIAHSKDYEEIFSCSLPTPVNWSIQKGEFTKIKE